MLRLELTLDVARRTAKAVEDYPHSKTLTRLPSPSRLFALCHHLAIRTGHCYSLPGHIVVAPVALRRCLQWQIGAQQIPALRAVRPCPFAGAKRPLQRTTRSAIPYRRRAMLAASSAANGGTMLAGAFRGGSKTQDFAATFSYEAGLIG